MKIDKEILYRYFNNRASIEEEKLIRSYIEESKENWVDYLCERKLFDAFVIKSHSAELSLSPNHKMIKVLRECMKIAAVLAIALSLSYFWLYRSDTSELQSVVSTLNGQMAQVMLPDGTQVNLNSNTRLEYPAHFNGKQREVKIEGEAYFNVTSDKKKPFIVNTLRSKVRVLGTKFYVEDYADSEVSQVALIQGSVEVTSAAKTVLLTPNHQVVIKDGQMKVDPIADFDVYRWREGLIYLKQQSIPEVMKTFEKYFGVKFILPKDKHSKRLVTGKFYISDGVEYALKILQRNTSFTYTRNEEKNTIVIH